MLLLLVGQFPAKCWVVASGLLVGAEPHLCLGSEVAVGGEVVRSFYHCDVIGFDVSLSIGSSLWAAMRFHG